MITIQLKELKGININKRIIINNIVIQIKEKNIID